MSRLVCCCLIALLPGIAPGQGLPSPVAWSPDSRWLAFVEEDAPTQANQTDLLFPNTGAIREAGPARAFRLWSVRVEDQAAVLLEESPSEIGPPAWRPDGEALAYCRQTPQGFEVVVREGTTKARSLARFRPAGRQGIRRAALNTAWSADGKRLAVERPEPEGLVILEASNGKEVGFVPGGILPAWHPSGREIAYFRWESADSVVACRADSDAGSQHALTHVSPPVQAPVWALGGKSLLVVDCPRSPDGSAQAVLLDLGQPEGRPAPLKPIENPLLPMQKLAGCWLAVDSAGVRQFYSVVVEGRDNAISHHRGAAVLDRFAPIEESIPITSLALAPDERRLAVRAGDSGPRGTVALIGLPEKTLTPLLPGPEAGSAWRRLLLRTLLQRLSDGDEDFGGSKEALPTVFPIVADGVGGPKLPARITRLADALSRAEDGAPTTPNPSVDDRLALFTIAYGKGDYGESLRQLGPIEAAIIAPDRRLRLLGLRAQLEAMGGQKMRAAARLEYLAELFPDSPGVPRTDAPGYDAISLGQEHAGWIESLKRRLFDEVENGGDRPQEPISLKKPGIGVQ